MRIVCRRCVAPALCAVVVSVGAADARADDGLRLNFAPAGARSQGLGGAFLGLADDATGAYANPAALTKLSERDLSLSPSLGSFVWPWPKWAVGVYGHRLADFSETSLLDLRPVTTELDILSWGAAFAVEVSDELSVGVGWELQALDLKAETEDFTRVDETERAGGLNAGLMWRPGGGWSIGGVYRRGTTFNLDSTIISELKVPDVYGLGFALQPTELWTVSLDVVRIELADLVAALPPSERASATGADATEVHLGAERHFPLGRGLLAARLGFWHHPEAIHYFGKTGLLKSLFPGRDDEVHVTAGLGRSFTNLQIDAGVDYSPSETKWSISSGVRF